MLTDSIITLRAPEPGDIDLLYIWENDASIWEDGAVRAPMSRKMIFDYVNNYSPDPGLACQLRLIITLNATNSPIGCVDLYDYDTLNRRSGVGIVIDEAHRNRGYGKAAVELLASYCHKSLGLHQLWAIVSRCNQASLALFNSCGFRSCGSLKSWIRTGETYRDALFFQRILVKS